MPPPWVICSLRYDKGIFILFLHAYCNVISASRSYRFLFPTLTVRDIRLSAGISRAPLRDGSLYMCTNNTEADDEISFSRSNAASIMI